MEPGLETPQVQEGKTRAPPQEKKSPNVSVGRVLVGNGVISDY